MDLANLVDEYCVEAILKDLTGSSQKGLHVQWNSSVTGVDQDLLEFYWALGDEVERLAIAVSENPMALDPLPTTEIEHARGVIGGSIRAADSVLLQEQTGDASAFVVDEPSNTYTTPANHIVFWLLGRAFLALERISARSQALKSMPSWVDARRVALERALRANVFQDAGYTLSLSTPHDTAARSLLSTTKPVYRLALSVLRGRIALSDGDRSAIERMLSQALIPFHQPWQRFELAVGLSMARRLAVAGAGSVRMPFPLRSQGEIARVGKLSVRWQYPVRPLQQHNLGPRIDIARDIRESLGMQNVTQRADLAVVDVDHDVLLALAECKWAPEANDNGPMLAEAIPQITDYAETITDGDADDCKALVQRSIIATGTRQGGRRILDGEPPVYVAGLNDVLDNGLSEWAQAVVSGAPSTSQS